MPCICQFEDVKKELAKHIRERRLIPVIGSGFSAGSPAFNNGSVPTGKEMKENMISAILRSENEDGLCYSDLEKESFADIATYYHELEGKNEQKNYIKNNFYEVTLFPERKKILEINWLYIYTLNMDDAIENCSEYRKVILPNRDVDFAVLEDAKCLIKLHGDVQSYLSYKDDNSQVFNYKQYAQSINNNHVLLNKLRHDFNHNNLIFIGCGLDGEFDLITLDVAGKNLDGQLTSKYYFTTDKPNKLKCISLKQYGITHIVLNEDYEKLYENIYASHLLSQEIPTENIDEYLNFEVIEKASNYEENKKYLFYCKSIVDAPNKKIIKPFFFTDRSLGDQVIGNLSKNTVHIIFAPRVSGKTYLLASIAAKVRDRDVYFFDSRNRLNDSSLNVLMCKKNVLMLFDTNVLSKKAIFKLIERQFLINSKHNNVVVAVNTSDKDIMSIVLNNIDSFKGFSYNLLNKFSENEVNILNEHLSRSELPNFYLRRTILDSLVSMGNEKKFCGNGKFGRIEPHMRNVDDLVLLILLAIKDKLYTEDLLKFDVNYVCMEQTKKTDPLITREHTVSFEKSVLNSSSDKFVVNAKYWLLNHLGKFVEKKSNHDVVAEAYQRIVERVTTGRESFESYSASMDYIKFDVINEIFQSAKYGGQLGLTKLIYETLQPLLSNNPHYYHQRAKCYLWQSGHEKSDLNDLYEALRFARLSQHNFQTICEKNPCNEKIKISLAHVKFTVALLTARISVICENSPCPRKQAISAIYDAIQSPYNTEDFKKIKEKRRQKKDDINDVLVASGEIDSESSIKMENIVKNLIEV